MYRLIVAGALLLAGCQNVIGPFQHRTPQRADDPLLPTYEQERRGRDRLPLPDKSRNVAPPSGVQLPGFTGGNDPGRQ